MFGTHTSFVMYFPDYAVSAFLGTCVQKFSQAYYPLSSKVVCQRHVKPVKLYKLCADLVLQNKWASVVEFSSPLEILQPLQVMG